ncbi:hypothetical protein C1H46_035169 [Malus baccata]|uniref:Uncharacterized protein n=1 Tax=Malus baccata TaxID=106549 RepID=A0A540KYF3_MALBA|nr:hypothetical protein C1H46_035169 [Malus baccata]
MGYLDEATINCEEPKAIISAVNEYAANGNCEQGFKSYIWSLEYETLEAYCVYVQIQHSPECKLLSRQNCPCYPTRLHGYVLEIYALGSGSKSVIEYLVRAFGIDPKRIISDKIVGYKIEDLELTTSVDEVKKGVWLGLKASTLYDKFTGTSFKGQFAVIKRMETIQLEVVVFLDFTFYADEDDDRSVFLVYLKILVRKDHGHHVVKTL